MGQEGTGSRGGLRRVTGSWRLLSVVLLSFSSGLAVLAVLGGLATAATLVARRGLVSAAPAATAATPGRG